MGQHGLADQHQQLQQQQLQQQQQHSIGNGNVLGEQQQQQQQPHTNDKGLGEQGQKATTTQPGSSSSPETAEGPLAGGLGLLATSLHWFTGTSPSPSTSGSGSSSSTAAGDGSTALQPAAALSGGAATSHHGQPPPPAPPAVSVAADPGARQAPPGSRVALKAALMDVVYCSARGVASSPDQRAGVEERVLALETLWKTPQPSSSSSSSPLSALHGRWKLVYTSHPQTLLLLTALDSLPLVDVGDVYQVVDTSAMTAYNKIDVTTPLSLISSLTAEARFEVQPPQALRVHLRRVGLDSQVQTPQVLAGLEIPDQLTVLGAAVDLTPLKRLIQDPLASGLGTARALLGAVAPQAASQVGEATSLWMLTTYLDDSLRISRDDNGAVFVMLKEITLYDESDP
ncbi:hypothetical protein V8C86DRAFT_2511085 [Haematococcus lacustris]